MIMYSILIRIKKINYKYCYGIYDDDDDVIICYKNCYFRLKLMHLLVFWCLAKPGFLT